jgi:hypothetical protein
MNKKLIRTIHPEIRIVDKTKGIVDYVASDETLDYYREIVRAAGWRFTNFQRNAPLVDSHDYSTVERLLGKVTDFRVEGGKLIERAQFAIDVAEQPLARLAWRLIETGYLKACSVGFMPVRMVSRWDDAGAWADAVKLLGLDAETTAKARVIYLEQEQMELSVCILGANPTALAKAYNGGVMNDDDMSLIETLSEVKGGRESVTGAYTADRAPVARGRQRAAWLREVKNQLK